MSLANRKAALHSLSRANWPRYARVDIDVEMLEDRVKDYRWCPYMRNFYRLESFSMAQRTKACGQRFSQYYSNKGQRAKTTPSVEIPDDVLRVHLERAKWIVIGVNDANARAPVPSQRALRLASRADQDVAEMIGDAMQDEADVPDDEADVPGNADGRDEEPLPDANGARRAKTLKRKQAIARNRKDKRRNAMSAEEQEQSARDRAARDARLTKEALEEFALDLLPELTKHDEAVDFQNVERDPGNGSLVLPDEWTGPESSYLTALDDGAPTQARMEAADSDLQLVESEIRTWKETADQTDPMERNVKLKLLSRVASKLRKIVAGTAGFSDLSRGDWRQQGCGQFIQDGSKYTCIQDSLVVAARYVGCQFSAKELHKELDDPFKEAEISAVVCYARETLGLSMVCVSHDSEDALTRVKGGIAFAVLQLRTGAFIIVLDAICADGTVERHAVAFLSDFQHPAYRNHFGALVDNDPRVSVRFLEPSDRASASAARNVFDGLFWTAQKVMITSVWKVSMPAALA